MEQGRDDELGEYMRAADSAAARQQLRDALSRHPLPAFSNAALKALDQIDAGAFTEVITRLGQVFPAAAELAGTGTLTAAGMILPALVADLQEGGTGTDSLTVERAFLRRPARRPLSAGQQHAISLIVLFFVISVFIKAAAGFPELSAQEQDSVNFFLTELNTAIGILAMYFIFRPPRQRK